MTIAYYTRNMMLDFCKLGVAMADLNRRGMTPYARRAAEAVARSRLQNAGNRLGVKITTRKESGAIVAKVIDYENQIDCMRSAIKRDFPEIEY